MQNVEWAIPGNNLDGLLLSRQNACRQTRYSPRTRNCRQARDSTETKLFPLAATGSVTVINTLASFSLPLRRSGFSALVFTPYSFVLILVGSLLPFSVYPRVFMMAFRTPAGQLTKRVSQFTPSKFTSSSFTALRQRGSANQVRFLATSVPPVTQDATGSKGPTAIVFMNMGGPATTDKVGDFLTRLFVSRATQLM